MVLPEDVVAPNENPLLAVVFAKFNPPAEAPKENVGAGAAAVDFAPNRLPPPKVNPVPAILIFTWS